MPSANFKPTATKRFDIQALRDVEHHVRGADQHVYDNRLRPWDAPSKNVDGTYKSIVHKKYRDNRPWTPPDGHDYSFESR